MARKKMFLKILVDEKTVCELWKGILADPPFAPCTGTIVDILPVYPKDGHPIYARVKSGYQKDGDKTPMTFEVSRHKNNWEDARDFLCEHGWHDSAGPAEDSDEYWEQAIDRTSKKMLETAE